MPKEVETRVTSTRTTARVPGLGGKRAAIGYAFCAAFAEGRTMSWEQAVEYALAED